MHAVMVALMAIGLAASNAPAQQVFTFNAPSGNFNNPANWIPQGIPDANDRIVIPEDMDCIVTVDATIDTMVVESDGTLRVNPGVTLTLENDDHIAHECQPLQPNCILSDNSIVNGTVVLIFDQNSATGGSLRFVNKGHTVAGEGSIRASDTTASKIQIAGDIVLKNQLAAADNGIIGAMTIEGLAGSTSDGVIFNQGRIEADGELIVDAEIDDSDGALWLSGCKSNLHFVRGSSSLLGDFSNDVIDDGLGEPGEFEFDETVKTCGAYIRSCGAITINNSAVFGYVDFIDLSFGSCPNPGTPPSGGPVNCTNRYEVTASVSGGVCG